jgi:hypothetical protein
MKWTKKLGYFWYRWLPKKFSIKKYTTNQNKKGNGYAFKDFLLDFVQKMTEMRRIVQKMNS